MKHSDEKLGLKVNHSFLSIVVVLFDHLHCEALSKDMLRKFCMKNTDACLQPNNLEE
jgi:hypothetical protein